MNVLIAGAGGFIGGHLVRQLLAEGHTVRAVDRKPLNEWWQIHPDAQIRCGWFGDMRRRASVRSAVRNIDWVYDLAADMGGMGFIESHRADCAMSVTIATELLTAAHDEGVGRFFFSSSACVYAAGKQTDPNVTALREQDAWPAQPEAGYGEEKLFTEQLCRYVMEDWGLECRVARFHNVYGPHGTWRGGREKAPAAICRKIAEAKLSGHHRIDIWGDGQQTRSFMYIDDCVEGVNRIMGSDIRYPINLGSSELVTINQLVTVAETIAGIHVERSHDPTAPQGVRGRNSDNTLILDELGWEPSIALADGLERTYRWIYDQMTQEAAA